MAASFKDDFTGSTLDPRWVITEKGQLGSSAWTNGNVYVKDGNLILRHQLGTPMKGAELRWKEPVFHGTLSARIKSGTTPGVLSTLFLYGFFDGKAHEIDVIELFPDQADAPNLTSYMEWSEADEYKPGPHYFHAQPSLPNFDCRDWHVYSVRWEPKKVTWFVDGKEAASTDKVVPFHPISIMLNSWHPHTWAKATPDKDSEQFVDWLSWEDLKEVKP